MIIDSQVLHTGTDDIFSAHGNSVAVSPRRFKDIADDDESISKDAYNKITKLLDHNKVFVAPFCDAALIYRHLKNANALGQKILQHKNLHWYTDGYLQMEVDTCVDQTYSLPSNFVAEFSGEILQPKVAINRESRYVCMMNNHREHRDHLLLNLLHRNMMDKGDVVYHGRRFDVPGVMDFPLFEDTRHLKQETYHGHITDTLMYKAVMIELVSEAFIDNLIFITEKCVRPMCAGIPAIYVAGRGYVQSLRDLGFEVYDHVIDHSYDTEADDWIRINKVCIELQHILNLYTPQQFYDATIENTMYNQKLLKEKYLNAQPDAFLKSWIADVGN